ncbi:MAG: hypothetical protein ACXACT_16410 [Candidatus Thorarchaeota archaeon]|jgi:hypothetical protein
MPPKAKMSHLITTVQPALMSLQVEPCDVTAVAYREDTGYRKYLEIILITKGPTVCFGIPKEMWKQVIDKLIEFHEYTEIMPEGFGYIGETKDE